MHPLLTLDSHMDTLERVLDEGFDPSHHHGTGLDGAGCVDLPRMREGGLQAAFWSCYTPQGPLTAEARDAAWARVEGMTAGFWAMLQSTPGLAAQAHNPEELRKIVASGRRALVLCLENTYPLGLDLRRLELLALRGFAYATLCHNGDNWVCGSCLEPGVGLSPFGCRMVDRMGELGMMVDLSHASEATLHMVVDRLSGPAIASHSSCRALCDHPRNLTDGAIRALAARGGVVQVCGYGPFLREGAHRARLDDLAAHAAHVAALVGPEHVGIGTDFDGGTVFEDCPDVSGLSALTMALARVGFTAQELSGVWGGNLLRVWEQVQAARALR